MISFVLILNASARLFVPGQPQVHAHAGSYRKGDGGNHHLETFPTVAFQQMSHPRPDAFAFPSRAASNSLDAAGGTPFAVVQLVGLAAGAALVALVAGYFLMMQRPVPGASTSTSAGAARTESGKAPAQNIADEETADAEVGDIHAVPSYGAAA